MSVVGWAVSVTARAPEPTAVTRVSLGTMVFAASVHELLGPLSWSVYVVPWLAPILVISPVTSMLVNGVLEAGFGAAIVVGRYTAPASAVAAVSLSMVCLYPVAVLAVEDGLFDDVLTHGIGPAELAWAVLINSSRQPTRTP